MQTEQAVTIEEHLHGFCCGKLEGEDVHVGTIIARNNKVFTGMFVFFLAFVYVCMSCHYYSLFLASYFHLCKTKNLDKDIKVALQQIIPSDTQEK